MRVFVAGATGVIGRALLPALVRAGHEVTALIHRFGEHRHLPAGVDKVWGDAFNRSWLISTLKADQPDAVVNMLTAIPAEVNPRRMAEDFLVTNRLRTAGTRNLLDAAEAAGATRVVSQSLAYIYDPSLEDVAREDAPTWRNPPVQFAPVLEALRYLERLTTLTAGGLVLRLGHLYGPGSIYAADGSFVRQVRAGRVPLVGDAGSVFSFVHVEDVASAVVAAVESDVTGILNVVDDDPTPMSQWLPEFARMLDAPAPRRIPVSVARMLMGGWGVAYSTGLRGADNSAARRALGWRPQYPSWRDGMAAELEEFPAPAA